MNCPNCRAQHAADNNERTFPHNEYLLVNVRRKVVKQHEKPKITGVCEEHGEELTLFCREEQCQKLVCRKCLRRQHNRHDVIDAEENQKHVLLMMLNVVVKDLEVKKD